MVRVQSPSAAPESVGGFAVAATKRNQSEITNISGPQPTHLVSIISLLPIVTIMSASCMPGAGWDGSSPRPAKQLRLTRQRLCVKLAWEKHASLLALLVQKPCGLVVFAFTATHVLCCAVWRVP